MSHLTLAQILLSCGRCGVIVSDRVAEDALRWSDSLDDVECSDRAACRSRELLRQELALLVERTKGRR